MYDLRRLRLRGLIERIPGTLRYRVTEAVLLTALCFQRTYARVLRPALSVVFGNSASDATTKGRGSLRPRDQSPRGGLLDHRLNLTQS